MSRMKESDVALWSRKSLNSYLTQYYKQEIL